MPTLHGVTFDGTSVAIEPTGTPQVVVFLAHWCPHCQAEVPRLVDLAGDGAFEGIDVTAVATGTSDLRDNYPPSAWLERENWSFPVLADDDRSSAAAAYGLPSYPFFVFIDAEGNIAGRATGEISGENLEQILAALAAGQPLPAASGASSRATN
jgi:thiol-disulfide isomerase/thioredoxin